MKIKISLILTLLALSCARDGVQKEQILGGSGDFRAFSFDSSIRRLHGEWLFRFEKSGDCAAEEMTEQNSILVKTPAYWSSYAQAGQNFPVRGRACFQLNLDLNPEVAIKGGAALFTNDFSSASEIYWNGVLIGKKGITGAGPDEELGDIGPSVWRIPDSLIQAHNTLKIRVSNFHLRGGGMNGEIFLGNSSVLADRIAGLERIDFFLLGSILLAGLYYFALWLGRREEKAYFWFFLSCISVSLRLFSSGSYMERVYNPAWMTSLRMYFEYMTAFSITSIFYLFFLKSLFPAAVPKIAFRLLAGLSAAIGFFLTVSRDASFYGKFQPVFAAFVLVIILFGCFVFIRAVLQKYVGARMMAAAYFIWIITIMNDLYQTSNVTGGQMYAPLGLFIFVYTMAAALGRKFNQVHKDLQQLSDSYARFVPQEFLTNLGKNSIVDIHLGDQVQRELTIMFSDIRSFTELSEKMTPEENFNFINSYLRRMSPIIRNHGGFIDKFLGDGIMALFAGPVEDAVRAAVEMQKYLVLYNGFRKNQGYAPIRIGIGLHTGKMMLGTIGEENRMDGTVISDAVNLASRIEGLTKLYGASIATSQEIIFRMNDPMLVNYRFLDRVRVKGKEQPVSVFEILDGDLPEILKLKLDTKHEYEKAVLLYQEKQFAEARAGFQLIIDKNPLDAAARLYMQRSEYNLEHALPADWEGIEVFQHK